VHQGPPRHIIVVIQQNLEVFCSCKSGTDRADSDPVHLNFGASPVTCHSVERTGWEDSFPGQADNSCSCRKSGRCSQQTVRLEFHTSEAVFQLELTGGLFVEDLPSLRLAQDGIQGEGSLMSAPCNNSAARCRLLATTLQRHCMLVVLACPGHVKWPDGQTWGTWKRSQWWVFNPS
jgi:hypothetical protein